MRQWVIVSIDNKLKHLTRVSHKPILSFCYIRVNTQLVARDQKYEGNIPIRITPQHAMASASTVVREGFGMVTSPSEEWKYITTTTLR